MDLCDGVSVVGFNSAVIDDGISTRSIRNGLAANVIPGTLPGGGETFRLPNAGDRLAALGEGIYQLDVTLDLSNGSQVSASVIWQVIENTEP